MPRLFTAIDVPEPIRHECLRIQPEDESGVVCSRAANLHITLHFIGEVALPVLERLRAELRSVAATRFELSIAGVGCFRIDDRPRFLWAGVARTPELLALRERIGDVITRLELPLESRDYRPHLTLARLDSPAADVVDTFVQQHHDFKAQLDVNHFALYSAERIDGESFYQIVESFELRE